MTHALRLADARSARTIGRPRAAVMVRVERKDLVVVPGIQILQSDALVAAVPEYLRVVDEDGKVIQPSEGALFLITTETFIQLPKAEW